MSDFQNDPNQILPQPRPTPLEPLDLPVRPETSGVYDELSERLGLPTSLWHQRQYGVDLTPAVSAIEELTRAIAVSPDPMGEINKINAAQFLGERLKIPTGAAYANFDRLSEVFMGKAMPPATFLEGIRDHWQNGVTTFEINEVGNTLAATADPAKRQQLLLQVGEMRKRLIPIKDVPKFFALKWLDTVVDSAPQMLESLVAGGAMAAATSATAGAMLGALPPLSIPSGGLTIPALAAAMGSVGLVVGTTQAMAQNIKGAEYLRMVDAGVPHNVASTVAAISGYVQGGLESAGELLVGLPFIPFASIGERIAGKILMTGFGLKVAKDIAVQVLAAGAGEGIENSLQYLTQAASDQLAIELAKDPKVKLDTPSTDALIREFGNQFYQGFGAGIIFGVMGIPRGIRANVGQMTGIRELAKTMPDKGSFLGAAKALQIDEGDADPGAWKSYLGKVYDQQHPGTAETETEIARGPEGRVYTEVETLRTTREGETAILKAGDPTTGKRYGFATFERGEGRIYIEDVVSESGQDIRRELVLDLMARYPGQAVEWNPTNEADVALKEELLAANPLGPEAGLQRFQVAEGTAQQELTRSLFVTRMGDLFDAASPEQAELYGKLADTFAQVSGQSTQDWLRQYIRPEVSTQTPATQEMLREQTGVAATRFQVGEQVVAPLSVDEFKGQVQAVFTALGKADFHHGVHEFFHAVERIALAPDQVKKFETALGKLRQTWTVEDIETLADRFEDYLGTGKAPTPELQSVFQQIAAALKALISFIRKRLGGEVALSPEFQAAYDALFAKPDSGLAQEQPAPVPTAPAAEVSQIEEGVPPSTEGAVTILSAVPPVEIELSRISLSAEVPNFKELADKKGVIEPLRGEEYVKVGIPPIVLWERQDGRLEVITGRHRLDLAQRLGLPTILSQVVREAEGFTAAMAMTFDAEANIRDGQGSVRDYANYFRNSEITEQQASRRGLLDRHKGRTGFAIGRYAADGLYSLYRNDQLSEAKTAAIAAASLGDERLQSLGVSKAKQLSADELSNFLALARQQITTTAGVQADMFGFDDSLILEGERIAKAVSAKKAELVAERQALSSAIRLSKGAQAKIVEKYGFKAGDTAAIQNRVDALGEELATWESWTQDPEKMREARQLAGLKVAELVLLHEEEGKPPEPPAFDLVPFSDKMIRPKAEKVVQPTFDFAKKTDVQIKDELDNLSLFHRDDALQKEFNAAAVKIFGTTEDPEHGAWILSNGKMPDFSAEKHKAADSYHGRLFHNEIKRALAELKEVTDRGVYSNAWRAGALRMDISLLGAVSIQGTMVPTPEQMQTIEFVLAGGWATAKVAMLEVVGTDIDERTLDWVELTEPTIKDVRRFYAKVSSGAAGRGQMLYHIEEEPADLAAWLGNTAASRDAHFDNKSPITIDVRGYMPGGERVVTWPVVLPKGNVKYPKTFYHGTRVTITGALRPGAGGAAGPGIYLAENRDKAEIFAGSWITGEKGKVYEVYSNVKNPFFVSAEARIHANELNAYARAHGYDSMYIPSEGEWVIFDPANIRMKESQELLHPEEWQGEFLYGTQIDAEIYQQYVELAKGFESAEAFRADIEAKYGEPGEADLAGEAAARFFQETWQEAHAEKPAPDRKPIERPTLEAAPQYDVAELEAVIQFLQEGADIADVLQGTLTQEKIEKMEAQAQAEEKKAIRAEAKEEVKKAVSKRKAATQLRAIRKKLIHDIMREPGRSIQFRGYAEQIRILQEGLNPTTREFRIKGGVQTAERTKKGYAREQTRRFFEQNPEAAALVPREKLEKFYTVNLQDMTMAELEEIDALLTNLRKLGTLKRHLELVARAREIAALRNRMAAAVLRGEDPEKAVGGVKSTGGTLAAWLRTLTPKRVLAWLDGVFTGKEGGPFSEFWQRYDDAWKAFKKAERARKERVTGKMKELGFTLTPLGQARGLEWVGRPFDIAGFRYTDGKAPTLQDVMYWYIGMQNEHTRAALLSGNNLPVDVVMKGIAKLNAKQRAMADVIDEDGAKFFPEYREAFIDEFNTDLPGENHYVRMVRKNASYESREDAIVAELTGRNMEIRKRFIARHSTYERIEIPDEFQKPIRTDLFNLWAEGVTEQEGFIHQYALVKEMHNTWGSPQVTAAINQKFGPSVNQWLKKYTNDLAQADTYRAMSGLEKIARMSRAHATVAWLGFNMLSAAKQLVGVSAFISDLGPLAPAYLVAASAKLAGGWVKSAAGGHFLQNAQVEFVKERSEFVRNRQISVDLENLKSTQPGTYSAIIKKIGKYGMKPLEVIDISTVTIGWTAVYDKVMRETQGNEAQAIAAADDSVMRNSPSARVQDLAEIYRQGEVFKWFTMFTSELSVIWNRLTFDIPLAFRRKHFYEALSNLVSISIAGVGIAIASGALDEDDEKRRKKLILGLFTEYIDSLPLIGSDVYSYIAGKQFQASGVKLIPPVTMWLETARQLTEGDWDAALQKGTQALSFSVGLPYTGAKRAVKAVESGEIEALLGWPEKKE